MILTVGAAILTVISSVAEHYSLSDDNVALAYLI